MGLGNLVPAQRTKPRKRLGRGQGSGRGGTSTRGHNGQKSRAGNGKPKAGFEGGQTPITRRYPKRGFTNIFAKEFTTVNVNRIQQWIDEGRLDPTKPITARELYESACVHSFGDGIKLLAKGAASLSHPIHLIVSRASPAAIAAVENSGGSIVCKYYSRVSLRALVKPEKYVGTIPIRQPDPIHKRDLVYYSNPATRGYLASRQTPLKSEGGPDATSE
jgi:large subunit ribosomal protein L15